MGPMSFSGISLHPLKEITNTKGNVLHALRSIDSSYSGFGEAYFSTILEGGVKAWKKHTRMTMNLIVPVGNIKFVFANDGGEFSEYIIGRDSYMRLTVQPGIWFGFLGLGKGENLLLNISDIIYSDSEVEHKDISEFVYQWERV